METTNVDSQQFNPAWFGQAIGVLQKTTASIDWRHRLNHAKCACAVPMSMNAFKTGMRRQHLGQSATANLVARGVSFLRPMLRVD